MTKASANSYDPENRDVLLRLTNGGDTLSKSRDVRFDVIFPDRESASSFTKHMQELGYAATFNFTERLQPLAWDVEVIVSMIPSEVAVGEFELSLARAADPLGGINDGWFCQRIVDNPAFSLSDHEEHTR